MCIERRRFTIRGTRNAGTNGHIAARFFEVDTQEQARWTFFLDGTKPVTPRDRRQLPAEEAGERRASPAVEARVQALLGLGGSCR